MKTILLAVTVSLLLIQAQPHDSTASPQDQGGTTWKSKHCHPSFPNLSVGDVNLTQSNLDKFKGDNEIFVVGVSDSQCERCCYTEGLLNSIWTGL